MKQVIAILNRPFLGAQTLKEMSLGILYVSLFVTAFRYIFQPFGINLYQGNKLILSVLFGVVTFIVGLSYDLFCHFVLGIRQDTPQWTFWKWMIFTLILLLFITIANGALAVMLSHQQYPNESFDFKVIFVFLKNTFGVGIFPVVASGFISMLRREKYFKQEAIRFQEQKPMGTKGLAQQTIHLQVKHSDGLSLEVDHVFYFETMENYVAVHGILNHSYQKILLRTTSKQIKTQVPDNSFLQCHRSYIVNLDKLQLLRVMLKV